MSQDFYKILGIKRDATVDDIRKSYRKLAMQYHPDKNQHNPDAVKKFQEIARAYEVLNDPDKKTLYDRYGEEGLDNPTVGMPPWMQHPGSIHRRSLQLKHRIKLKEYFTNHKTIVKVPKDLKCDTCDATGFTDRKPHLCKKCGGSGMILIRQQHGHTIIQQQSPCPTCKGRKKDTSDVTIQCGACKGKGTKKVFDNVEVDIPKRIITSPVTMIPDGYVHRGQPIDLTVIFQLKLTKDFGFTGDRKLIYITHINLTESLCGFRKIFHHPNGKKVLITSNPGYVISPHYIYSIHGLGLFEGFNGESDPMYLTFVVNYPGTISLPKKKALTWLTLETTLGNKYEPDVDIDNCEYDLEYNLKDLVKTNNDPKAVDNNSEDQEESEASGNSEEENPDDIDMGPQMPGGCAQQ